MDQRSIWMMTREVRKQILEYFYAGQDINHIVYLLNYKFTIDAITQVIRDRLMELESVSKTQ